MDYAALAEEMVRCMFALRKGKPNKNISEALRGEEIALVYMGTKGDEILPGELSQALGLSTARIAATLNSLEKKGLVTREIDPDNRRQILVRLTDAGREFSAARRARLMAITTGMLTTLGEEDAREFVRITKRLTELMPSHECMFSEESGKKNQFKS